MTTAPHGRVGRGSDVPSLRKRARGCDNPPSRKLGAGAHTRLANGSDPRPDLNRIRSPVVIEGRRLSLRQFTKAPACPRHLTTTRAFDTIFFSRDVDPGTTKALGGCARVARSGGVGVSKPTMGGGNGVRSNVHIPTEPGLTGQSWCLYWWLYSEPSFYFGSCRGAVNGWKSGRKWLGGGQGVALACRGLISTAANGHV